MIAQVHDDPEQPPAPEADADATYAQLGQELAEYVWYYLSVRLDQWRDRAHRAAILGVAGILALSMVVAALMVATALLLIGAAVLLGEALGGRLWLGCVGVGAGVLLATVTLGGGVVWRMRAAWRAQLRKKYEHRREQQREQFGRDISEPA
ncbi:MAG: hypothetical protein JSS27_01980 [Planctomycetes bacterium]|nr:hypothetical protein [Planctomycetota bacterium]